MTNAAAGHVHDALFHQSGDDLAACAAPVLRAALAASEAVVLSCAEASAQILTAALGGDPRISFVGRSGVFRRAAAAISACQRIAGQHLAAGARRVALVGELDFTAGQQDRTRRASFEAIASAALVSYPIWSVCIYGTRQLPREVLAAAERTHPFLITPASRQRSPRYLDPARFLRQARRSRPDPLEETAPVIDVTSPADLAGLRREMRAALAGTARRPETVHGFVLAVSEVVTNALTHGRPPVRVRAWTTASRSVCTVADHGDGFADPLAGYLPARLADRGRGGLGLWLARQGCDDITAEREHGSFTVRIVTRH